jgi:hypothetical protein
MLPATKALRLSSYEPTINHGGIRKATGAYAHLPSRAGKRYRDRIARPEPVVLTFQDTRQGSACGGIDHFGHFPGLTQPTPRTSGPRMASRAATGDLPKPCQ